MGQRAGPRDSWALQISIQDRFLSISLVRL